MTHLQAVAHGIIEEFKWMFSDGWKTQIIPELYVAGFQCVVIEFTHDNGKRAGTSVNFDAIIVVVSSDRVDVSRGGDAIAGFECADHRLLDHLSELLLSLILQVESRSPPQT